MQKKSMWHVVLIGLGVVLLAVAVCGVLKHLRESPTPIKTEYSGRRTIKTYATAADRDKAAHLDNILYGSFILFMAGAMACGKGAKMAVKRSQERRMAPFQPHLPAYLDTNALVMADGDAYIAGRVVSVDPVNGVMHPFFLSLPGVLRATAPEQVGTVVWVEEQKEVTGTFSQNLPALRLHWRVTLIDLNARRVIQQFDVAGAPPPSQVAKENLPKEEARTGRPPTKEVVRHLVKLPRR